jgi:hypothetical protein
VIRDAARALVLLLALGIVAAEVAETQSASVVRAD